MARIVWAALAGGLLVAAVLTGLLVALGPPAVRAAGSTWSRLTDPAAAEADEHAATAGAVMLKGNHEVPASAAAAMVVGGSLPGDTIEALVADGTTRQGRIVLRITVLIPQTSTEGSRGATRCYRYDLVNTMDDGTPRPIHCPDTPAIAVRPLPPPAQLPQRADLTLAGTLNRLTPAQRSNPDVVKDALVRAYRGSAGVTVESAERPDGTVGVAVFATTNPTACLGARLPVGGPPLVVYPARVAVLPGELGCSAMWFGVPHAYDPPH